MGRAQPVGGPKRPWAALALAMVLLPVVACGGGDGGGSAT